MLRIYTFRKYEAEYNHRMCCDFGRGERQASKASKLMCELNDKHRIISVLIFSRFSHFFTNYQLFLLAYEEYSLLYSGYLD